MKRLLYTIGYWLIHIIWAAPTFIVGLLVSLFMLLTWHRPYKFGLTIYFVTSKLEDCGFNVGPIFVLAENCKDDLSMKQHEHGHGIQALWWGPITGLVIYIPSFIRFYYREIIYSIKRKQYIANKITYSEYAEWLKNRPKYDDIWFEGQASSIGAKYFN